MTQHAVEQATCEACDEKELRIVDSTTRMEINAVKYDVTCTCGESGIIVVDDSGTYAGTGINHDDASWAEE